MRLKCFASLSRGSSLILKVYSYVAVIARDNEASSMCSIDAGPRAWPLNTHHPAVTKVNTIYHVLSDFQIHIGHVLLQAEQNMVKIHFFLE